MVGFHPNSEFVTVETLQNGKFSSEFRRDVGKFSRFEAFLGDAFDVHAGVWLVGSWATRAGWLPVVAIWLLKVENVAKVFLSISGLTSLKCFISSFFCRISFRDSF